MIEPVEQNGYAIWCGTVAHQLAGRVTGVRGNGLEYGAKTRRGGEVIPNMTCANSAVNPGTDLSSSV
jgi:hypothetical protein